MAIQDSPNKKLRLRDIIAWIEAHYPYFSQKESDWKNCVRHSLSVNPMFFRDDMSVKCGRRGSYWNVKDIPLDAAAMKRRRKMKRKMSEAQLDCMNMNNSNAALYAKNARRSLPEDVLRSNIAANIKAIKAMQSKKLDFDIDTIAKPHYEAFDRISSVTPEADDTISKIASIDQFISEMMYWDKIEL
ncbi:hypothetical protein O9G_003914 [Rozella allomycis CSF55]|uniref:Fork-head domain-containing protein n=1 Tax=Rozella allomycis (strain CSF55) TaxID=988480 RepID=A0A075ASZ7_ROZAC|nr:hypothetical protein O9G_003914 [Rozella allomycis CSF55]|eukprot:EPZ33411.1 hypothetical protein O9G_003914 [Rozella allomycis CSF55]